MTAALLLTIVGLAALDSLNPATMVSVILTLLSAPRRPGLTAGAVIMGAALTVFTVGALLFITAGAVAAAIDGLLIGLRFVAFGAAGIALVVAGIRRLRDRPRSPLELPAWFSPATAVPFGVIVTAADLPNAFPYFIAIERLVDADIGIGAGLLVIAGYAVIYCVPCLVLLVVGLVSRERTTEWLRSITRRFTEGSVPRSIVAAVLLMTAGVLVAGAPVIFSWIS
ncbi:GAP family protein [Microcella humidisoli]|uniref:GAP family protein n=1 Tax=Microcella humidisoli TaxID=2963406 RepID=A0ABY5G0W1_9MICO|nr:GAP family protein [Microcella humidisoli]UTT63606.1 GAP family protein [Microcella humidisoli]